MTSFLLDARTWIPGTRPGMTSFAKSKTATLQPSRMAAARVQPADAPSHDPLAMLLASFEYIPDLILRSIANESLICAPDDRLRDASRRMDTGV
jgi:hypothetical protein